MFGELFKPLFLKPGAFHFFSQLRSIADGILECEES
jgi:hypothetical protein